MRMPKIFSAMAAALILLATSATHAEPKAIDFVEGVDWSQKVITATGTGFAPTDAVNSMQAESLAANAARADAYRNLAETVNGVRVEGNITVGKMPVVQVRVAATIKGAQVVTENSLGNGGYRVVMQLPLFGANSLAGAVLERTTAVEPFPAPVNGVEPTIPRYNSATPIKQRLELTTQEPFADKPNIFENDPRRSPLERIPGSSIVKGLSTMSATKKPVADYADKAEGVYTGLIVDCRGLNLQPVMSPVIFNTNGTKIFGHKNIDPDKVSSQGMADYVKNPDAVSRAGENPLVVKAIRLENFNSCPVLSIADSNRVLIENYATKFLNDLKVVFLFD